RGSWTDSPSLEHLPRGRRLAYRTEAMPSTPIRKPPATHRRQVRRRAARWPPPSPGRPGSAPGTARTISMVLPDTPHERTEAHAVLMQQAHGKTLRIPPELL